MLAGLAGKWIEERRQAALQKLAEKGRAHDLLAKAIRARLRASDAAARAGGLPDNTASDRIPPQLKKARKAGLAWPSARFHGRPGTRRKRSNKYANTMRYGTRFARKTDAWNHHSFAVQGNGAIYAFHEKDRCPFPVSCRDVRRPGVGRLLSGRRPDGRPVWRGGDLGSRKRRKLHHQASHPGTRRPAAAGRNHQRTRLSGRRISNAPARRRG